MFDWSEVIAAGVGLVVAAILGSGSFYVGYTMGHRAGKVAGELSTLKSSRSHDRSRRPARQSGELNSLSNPPAV